MESSCLAYAKPVVKIISRDLVSIKIMIEHLQALGSLTKMAIRKGYTLLSIYEVWNFRDISYNMIRSQSLVGLLPIMLIHCTFLKVKQEASGWPGWCKSQEDKQQYIFQYLEKEVILLDYNNIKRNIGLRSKAKLMLNSF